MNPQPGDAILDDQNTIRLQGAAVETYVELDRVRSHADLVQTLVEVSKRISFEPWMIERISSLALPQLVAR